MSSSMTDSADFKDIVKQQADIVRIVGDYVKLKQTGARDYSGTLSISQGEDSIVYG